MYFLNSFVFLPVKCKGYIRRFFYLLTTQRKGLILSQRWAVSAQRGYAQISLPISANAVCVMGLRAGEDGETSSVLASASIALFSALEPYQFTLHESKSLTRKLSWVRGTLCIRRENCALVTCT